MGTLHGQRVVFLARHGCGHRISPTQLNQRVNIYGVKTLGVEYLIAANTCGSLREEFASGHIVIPDQLLDRTRNRALSFFDDPEVGTGGLVVHVSVTDPFCPVLSDICYKAVTETGETAHLGGAFVTIEGSRFSTKAESHGFRGWGMDIIGMTTTPEAFLAREAEMSYACMAHVTDYDVWHESEEPVTVEGVIRTLLTNADIAKQAIENAIKMLESIGPSSYENALQDAIITDKSQVPESVIANLGLIVGKYFDT